VSLTDFGDDSKILLRVQIAEYLDAFSVETR
jgi:hypothetical protein